MDEKIKQFKTWVSEWLREAASENPESPELYTRMWDALSSVLNQRESAHPPLNRIFAEEVTLIVTDAKKGRVFLRQLPLAYSETSNGITLKGETFAAEPTEIVFFTEFALGKLLELQGQGQNEPECGGHHAHDHDGAGG